MDPISTVAGLITLSDSLTGLFRSPLALHSLSREVQSILQDADIFVQIIKEIEQDIFASDHSLLPLSIEGALKQCAWQGARVREITEELIRSQQRRRPLGDGSKLRKAREGHGCIQSIGVTPQTAYHEV